MRASVCFAALVALATALPTPGEELYTIELAPGETKQVTEAEKWKLKSEGVNFFDITEFQDFQPTIEKRQAVTFPSTLTQGTSVRALNAKLSSSNMQTNLQTFSDFNNRYYRATTGKQSSDWLLAKVKSYVPAGSAITVTAFSHSFVQSSIIAKIPGKSVKTIVVGAHQDSINQQSPTSGRAPGADDDGSGTVTILDAFRTLLTNSTIASGQAPQTIEFHWYAGEEGGLLGSQAIFNSYSSSGRDVKAMLNQDMTGYTQGYKSAGLTPKFGVITDNVNAALTAFTKRVITAYTSVGFADDRCGYACSDHASATRAGYPSAMIFESEMAYENPYIHTTSDTINRVDFAHMVEHAKLVVGFVVELAFAAL
ncbi:Zn-dependent exopeptidase [Aaosphaeria arxii CBS 175.79]|uniref:Peptide hydrolase n=1 Tax=Aaosphaeria arxii CBS 175.79 TaxID=1450172 RepID=A0A6A5Y3N1_9PLEO|nr:Zn-dependent exopeptidase [Aaosphaeria arxii CBS 175.79]KAF2019866.1 Zn-dependent exopeptidase [Aaosphaeria arxii CBS 175.79]